ncbi:MAG: hypothetical protein KJO21_09900 [Verrucomicrobiae bacterium]|nr:hypothetical protein [Verrucomicrobiae bacterium]NNJ43771.1 hypothetical protein [Akkermansiaceae bacterium]
MNPIDEERSAFNQQMNEWVSRQGLWFQLRHAADGQTVIARMTRIGLRFGFLLFLMLLVFWFYLVKRVEGESFRTDVELSVESALHGSDCKVSGVKKERDVLTFASIEMMGTGDSFFHQMKARSVRMSMKVADGLIGHWDAGGIYLRQLDMLVKAGASDDAAAAQSYSALFDQRDRFSYDWIEADTANIRWGYSANNRGSITGSHMTAVRDGESWRIEFKGGRFSQNWLRDLTIAQLVVVCNQDGIQIKRGTLQSGGGEISIKLNMGSGGQPQATGVVALQSMPIKALLPALYHDRMEGTISGKGTVSGSTNSQEGIVMDLDLSLDDGDVLVMRDKLPLFSALTVVDLFNSYRKVSFTEGGVHIRTGGNTLKIDQIHLGGEEDLLQLAGEIDVRPPTDAEIAEALDIKDVKVVRGIIEDNWKINDEILQSLDFRVSLADAAKGVGDIEQFNPGRSKGGADDVRTTSVLVEKNVRRFGGLVKVGLKRDAFDKAPELKRAYPIDASSGRIWLDVPLSGRLQSLTLALAERLYVLGRKRE